MAVPAEDGGVDLFISTQWLHVDRDQVAASLDLPPEKVRIGLSGVGGAFGGREDLSMQVHACLLALHTGKPVKMMYGREESFFGHIHRHPARMRYEHGADRDGRLVYIRCRILLDGGAYASSSTAVCSNAASFACGPYDVPNALIDSYVVYTDNPPCGAMRGFGAVQTCFAHEAQMDKLAAALAMDPVELRRRNALAEGAIIPTGATIRCPAPVAELLDSVSSRALPAEGAAVLPGGHSNTTHGEGVRRGVGYAVGYKNVGYSEGFDDYSTARVRLSLAGGEPLVEVHTAAAEVGQGLVTVQEQIARHELGVERVIVLPADTQVGSAGSSSASRQTYMTGGAVKLACEAVREELERRGTGSLVELIGDDPIDVTREHHHRETFPLDEKGQGDAHVTFAFAAHRAVVDVDVDLGLVRVVEIATAQDVGKAINPQAVEGQIQGGIAQGLGLALMEEIQVVDGKVRNASFTDYLIPTVLDMPPVELDVLELADPERAVRAARRRRAADDLLDAGDRLRAAGGHRRGPDARAGPARRHRGDLRRARPACRAVGALHDLRARGGSGSGRRGVRAVGDRARGRAGRDAAGRLARRRPGHARRRRGRGARRAREPDRRAARSADGDALSLIAVARGDEPPDLVIEGARVLSVFTREWLELDVAVSGGVIAGLGDSSTTAASGSTPAASGWSRDSSTRTCTSSPPSSRRPSSRARSSRTGRPAWSPIRTRSATCSGSRGSSGCSRRPSLCRSTSS